MEYKEELTDLNDGVYLIDTGYLGKRNYAAIYLFVDNGEAAIIETSTNYSFDKVNESLSHLGISKQGVKAVIVTHVHLDHAGGAGKLMNYFSEAKLYVHPRGAKHMINPEKLISSVKQVYGEENYHKMYGEIIPVKADRVVSVENEFRIKIGNKKLTFFHAPGHAKHHMIVFEESGKNLFSGDSFGIGYPRFIFDNSRFIFASTSPVQFNPDEAKRTYDLILNLKPKRVLLTHFGELTNIKETYDLLNYFIEFSLKSANNHYDNGLRSEKLYSSILSDLWNEYDNFIVKSRGKKLNDEERDLLFLDADLNSKGVGMYIEKINSEK